MVSLTVITSRKKSREREVGGSDEFSGSVQNGVSHPLISALGKLRQEDYEFETSKDYVLCPQRSRQKFISFNLLMDQGGEGNRLR